MDKIFVNHFLREVEIGAFQSERGCKQRLEFNVWLEIESLVVEFDDNVDRILSYEIITQAINKELESQRFNLLETLAEKIAQRCLIDRRVIRVEVKIEKLDRIPGSLGVSILRERDSFRVQEKKILKSLPSEPFSLDHFSLSGNDVFKIESWLSKLTNLRKPFAVILETASSSLILNSDPQVQNNIDLLAMDQNVWLFSNFQEDLMIVNTKAELRSALLDGKVALFCLSQFVKQGFPDAPLVRNNSKRFSIWLARQMEITNLFLIASNSKRRKISEGGVDIVFYNDSDWEIFK